MKVLTVKLLLSESAHDILREIGYTDEQILDEARWVMKCHMEEIIEEIGNGILQRVSSKPVDDKNVKIL
jgi:hypothetical protein